MNNENIIWGTVLLLAAAISWGGMFVVANNTLKIIDPFSLTFLRYAIAVIIFGFFLFYSEGIKSFAFEKNAFKLFVLGSLGFAGAGLFSFIGLIYSNPRNGAVIMATQPLLTAVVLWLSKRARPSIYTICCIVVAFIGVLLVITNGNLHNLTVLKDFYGDFLIFCGALSWVIYSIGGKGYPHWSSLRYTTLTCALGLITILVVTMIAFHFQYIKFVSLGELQSIKWEMLYIILIASILTVFCWNKGIKEVGPLNGALFINFVPVSAFLITCMQGSPIENGKVLGAVLVILSLIVNNLLLRVNNPVKN